MNVNPKAATMTDPRWPGFVVDLGYVRKLDGFWRLYDSFGDEIIRSENRSAVFFFAVQADVQVVPRH